MISLDRLYWETKENDRHYDDELSKMTEEKLNEIRFAVVELQKQIEMLKNVENDIESIEINY